MTLASLISDIYESLTFTEVRADAPVEDTPEQAEEAEEEEPEDVFPALVEGASTLVAATGSIALPIGCLLVEASSASGFQLTARTSY